MMAAAAMMFAACAETELVNEVNTVAEPQAIGFETFANKATRATENNAGEYSWKLQDHHLTFKVWGGKNADGSLQSVYATGDPGVVTFGTAWVADPLKYWDKTAGYYDFMAAAPAEPAAGVKWVATTTTDHDFSTATLALNSFVLKGTNLSVTKSTNYEYNWKGDQDVDLLISENTKVLRAAYNKATPDDVNLDFIHILSRLNIIVKKGSGITSPVNVTALKVYNLKNKGSFDETTAAVNTTPGTAARWSSLGVEGTYELAGKPIDDIAADDARYIIQSLVIPQTVIVEDIDVDGSGTKDEAYFEIQYTIDGEQYHGFYNLAKAMSGAANYTFGEGWQNNLTITINPAGITFSGDVSTWAVVKDGTDID